MEEVPFQMVAVGLGKPSFWASGCLDTVYMRAWLPEFNGECFAQCMVATSPAHIFCIEHVGGNIMPSNRELKV